MQRIDQNTYIDDTLVTCAEYQLFIDEMREQGKYYHPDHWTSFQFPEGRAREPILGVRRSDAETFCQWLTQKGELPKWSYRLPSKENAVEHPMKYSSKAQLGYWISFDFFFLEKNLPTQLLAIDLDVIKKRYHNIFVSIDRKRSFHSLALGIRRDFDILTDRDSSNEETQTNNFIGIHHTEQILAEIHELSREFAFENKALQILYSEIFTLQERIAGRSPAFEGIRLVKERIR